MKTGFKLWHISDLRNTIMAVLEVALSGSPNADYAAGARAMAEALLRIFGGGD